MKTSSLVAVIVAVIVIIGLVWYFSVAQNGSQPSNVQVTQGTGTGGSGNTASSTLSTTPVNGAAVAFDGRNFNPATVTIAKGGTVTWMDQSNSPMWVASGMHPTHTLYDGTNRTTHCASGYTGPVPFDQCAQGQNYTFTFDKAGTWKYHNHLSPSITGTVVVQ